MNSILIILAVLCVSSDAIKGKDRLADAPPFVSPVAVAEANATAAANVSSPIAASNGSIASIDASANASADSNSSLGQSSPSPSPSAPSVSSEPSSSSLAVTSSSTASPIALAIPLGQSGNGTVFAIFAEPVKASESNATGSSSIASTQASSSSIVASTLAHQASAAAGGGRLQQSLPGLPLLPTRDNASLVFFAKGSYVKTSAFEKACKQNQDCYNMREPDEWCPLPDQAKYGDKGCFCDHLRNVCTIQRESGKGEEYTDCAEKSTSTCGLKPVVRIQHPKNKQRRRVH